MRSVYFAHAVTNTDQGYEHIGRMLRERLGPVEVVEPRGRLFNDVLAEAALEAVRASDLVIADVSDPSAGVGIEIGYALGNGIPVFAMARAGSEMRVSAFIRGLFPDMLFYASIDALWTRLAADLPALVRARPSAERAVDSKGASGPTGVQEP